MSKRKSPAEKEALAREVTRLSQRWIDANKDKPEFNPEHYATKKNPFGDKEKAFKAYSKALKAVESELCKDRGLVYKKYEDGEYLTEAPKSLMELHGKGVGGHRGVAHPKTKKETAEYFQKWYKKNRTKVLKRINKQRSLDGGAYSDDESSDEEEGAGFYRMGDGCTLYTGGAHVEPVNYGAELKDNSWYPMGYSGGARVMPVNHSAELSSYFGTF
jgi:phenylpyruvate tautomerase PptA (4-oxalocrotonate tautomerase family)